MRIACYCRVSTEEQARHGLSIETQLANLREWAKQNHHVIIKEYIDAGISGKKPYTKRPALSSFITDLESGLSVDALVFCKLDRFFRSVKHYYQIVAIMERYHVGWQTIHEEYETLTSQGQFMVNLMLSIAEAEASRTSERIKTVFDHKKALGYRTNKSAPLGYSVIDGKLVPDENAEAARALFEYYDSCGSAHQAMEFLRQNYGISKCYRAITNTLRNPSYYGTDCPALIDKALWDRVQYNLSKRAPRVNQSNRIYIFSGLLVCAECGSKMIGTHVHGRKYYRCHNAFLNHLCANRHAINEKHLEQYLLEHVAEELDAQIAKAKLEYESRPHKTINPSTIQAKLDRLNELYVEGTIDKTKYTADREKLIAALQQATIEATPPNYAATREIIGKDFQAVYAQLTPQSKQSVWRSIIDHIIIDRDKSKRLIFRG